MMTKWKQRLTMGQGQTTGKEYIASLGAAIALLLSLFMPFATFAHPVRAQVQNGIREPDSGTVVSGVVSIQGTATHHTFLRYELAFNNGEGWLVFAEGDQAVVDGTLAIWDTTIGQPQNPVFPDGAYQLRLRVVRQDYNYDEYFVRNVTLMNATTATPTETATAATEATTVAGTPAPGSTPTSGFMIVQPTPLPSLTPFATPTSIAVSPPDTDPGGIADPRIETPQEGGEGLLARLLGIDTGRFGDAFWGGAGIALVAFSFLALYLLLRALMRYAWRHLWTGRTRQD